MCVLGLVLGTVACYAVGTVWLAVQIELDFYAALMVGVVPFLVGDLIKIVMALWIGNTIRGQIKKAGFMV
jgi:biotin transport system substrate-specific component